MWLSDKMFEKSSVILWQMAEMSMRSIKVVVWILEENAMFFIMINFLCFHIFPVSSSALESVPFFWNSTNQFYQNPSLYPSKMFTAVWRKEEEPQFIEVSGAKFIHCGTLCRKTLLVALESTQLCKVCAKLKGWPSIVQPVVLIEWTFIE